ncbi:MAG: glutamate 5-kinase [Coriobacteriia bacterium]|nr:glutamate 5-kinase [Coriobacteriia bacterium]
MDGNTQDKSTDMQAASTDSEALTVSNKKRVVVKVGSNTLTNDAGAIDRRYIASLADQLSELNKEGHQVVLVSSGAIAAGREFLGLSQRPSDMATLQAAASIGQVGLIETYAAEFGRKGTIIGQVLLTRADTENEVSYGHACDTFNKLLDLDSIPIVNENDTVAIDEICFGDNDTLAALVARMIRADMVVILTDVAGLYDADPNINPDAQVVPCLTEVGEDLLAETSAGGDAQSLGSGGMRSKLQAAKVLLEADIATVLCDGRQANVIVDAVEGTPQGTIICSEGFRKQLELLDQVPSS